MRLLPSIRLPLLLLSGVIVACAGKGDASAPSAQSGANGILGDPTLAAAISAALQSNNPGAAACKLIPENVGSWVPVPPGNVVGAYPIGFTFQSDCVEIASSDSSGVGQACSGEVTYNLTGNGNATQTNAGGVSTGTGNAYILDNNSVGDDELIVETDDAMGAGCEQHTQNLLFLSVTPPHPTGTTGLCCIVTAIDSSTCGGAGSWKVSVGSFVGVTM